MKKILAANFVDWCLLPNLHRMRKKERMREIYFVYKAVSKYKLFNEHKKNLLTSWWETAK